MDAMLAENSKLDREISTKMLLRFALPTIVSMVFMGIYSIVDGIFVANLVGTDALSAVNIVWPLVAAATSIGTMFGTGSNAIIARKLGEGKPKEARQDMALIVAAAFSVSVLLSALGFIFLDPLLRFLGADDLLFPYCRDYAVVILGILPLAIFSMIFNGYLITAGKAQLGLALSVFGGVTNMALDYLFIAVFGWGIAGAAAATAMRCPRSQVWVTFSSGAKANSIS